LHSLVLAMSSTEALCAHFRDALRADPTGAYRDWFRAQEQLRERGEGETACALADDLWDLLPELPFGADEERARFFHNAAVFYGSPGPAADLARSRAAFARALAHFERDAGGDGGWHARALHNLATALSNLGTTPADLSQAVALFEQALGWRTAEREIARGVTLHNLCLALRRLAELSPGRAAAHLDASAAALREAIAIRARNGLAEGRALSERHLALTLARIGEQSR
jgi:hypothetical protein